MTIQETIIEALRTVQTAHTGALSTITKLKADKAALEAEVSRLNSHVANLKSHVAHLEAEAVKIVEPEAVRSLLASLAQVVAEGQQANVTPVAQLRPAPTTEANIVETLLTERIRREEPQVIGQNGLRANSVFATRGESTRVVSAPPLPGAGDAANG